MPPFSSLQETTDNHAIRELRDVMKEHTRKIDEANNKSDKLNMTMVWLAIVTGFLTFVQALPILNSYLGIK